LVGEEKTEMQQLAQMGERHEPETIFALTGKWVSPDTKTVRRCTKGINTRSTEGGTEMPNKPSTDQLPALTEFQLRSLTAIIACSIAYPVSESRNWGGMCAGTKKVVEIAGLKLERFDTATFSMTINRDKIMSEIQQISGIEVETPTDMDKVSIIFAIPPAAPKR